MEARNSPLRKICPPSSIVRSLLIVAVITCSLGAAGAARAATYYLNTTSGSDSNPGTSSAPWQSLSKVQSSAAAGDVIVIQAADVSTYAALWPTHVSYRARVLRQFEITWTFDTEYPVGQFANRDLWVVGPVKIVGINPASTSVSGRVINGSMLNPPAGWTPQGYDSAMPDNTYNAAMNVAYNRSAGNPLTLAANSSLVSSISMATVGGKTTLQRAAILTVLAAPAHEGDFRPPYCGTDKTPRFNVSMLNRSLLRSLPLVSGTPSMAEVESKFEAPWLDHHAGWVGDQMHPLNNMPDYGREIHTWIGIGGLMLHLNFTPEQKETLLRRYLQVGIDWYGVMINGGNGNWPNAGGHGGGRKWPILFAGIMLNDTAMKSIGAKSGDYLYQNGYGPGNVPPDYVHFGEDDQTFYVAQVDVDATHSPNWRPDSRDTVRTPYETSDIGLPEWGIEHSTDPYQSNKWLPTEYRGVAGPPFHGTALAALLIPGSKALWNHNAYFDYTDRYMVFTGPGGEYEGWWHTMSTFTDQMWDTYRAQFGPIWPAVGSSAPVLTPIGNQQVTTGQALTLMLSATGGSGTLTYSASGLPTGATFSGNTFTWTPGATQAGSYQVAFTVSDGKAQDSETITISVTKANSPPVLAAIGNQSIDENQLLTFTISATDADGNPITYSATGLPSGATLTGQTFSWTPTYSQAGSYNVAFVASDGQTQDSQTITLTVVNVDRPPVLAGVGDQTVNVGSPLSFTLSATDPDGDSLMYSGTPLPSGATLTGQTFAWTPTSTQAGSYTITFTASDGTLTSSKTTSLVVVAPNVPPVLATIGNKSVNENQLLTFTINATDPDSSVIAYSATGLPSGASLTGPTFSWTPTYTQAGSYTVTFVASDGQAQDTQIVSITVTNVDRPPVLATIGNKSVNENQLLTFTISAADADGNPITYSATGLPGGASLTGPTFSWTPTYSQAGSYNVAFVASAGQAQDSQTVTITVANVDRPPVLADIGGKSVEVTKPLSFTLSATDPDGDGLTFSADGLPSGATLTGQTFAWTPTSTQAGSYTITFTASDGTLTDSRTATITVAKANVAPVLATIGNKSVNENQLLTFTVSATDADGNPITYSATGLPNGATLTGSTFSWTPTHSQAGGYNVTFVASDGQAQDAQTVTITVANVDRPPVLANIGSRSVGTAQPLSLTLSATDPDGDSLTFSADALPSGATLTGQTFAWTPTSSQVGSYAVAFTVSDGTLTDSKTATITVATAVKDQVVPVVAQCSPAPDAIQVPLNNLVTFHITDANSGVDANSIAIRVNGSLVYQGNTDARTSASGRCSRTGTPQDYGFIYQANALFDFDETITISVNATDLAGNAMSEYTYSFTTQMRAFGKNLPISTLGGSADSRPATARDSAGNIWATWHAGPTGSRDIYVAKLPVGSTAFQTPMRLTSDTRDQCNPALAVDAVGTVYVVWQDNRNGNWDLYLSLCLNGSNFAKEVRVTSSNRNEINPVIALDRQSPASAYVAWQDDRDGNQDIYVAKSTDGFASSTVVRVTSNAADQVEPKVVVDSGNVGYLFWTDLRNGQADIYAATSSGGTGGWAEVAIVAGPGPETQPAVAVGSGVALHLVWMDSSGGNSDIYYARLNGLPSSPVAGINIIDDTSGADQTAPAIVCGADQKVFACWTDARHTGADDTDTDLYVAELRAGGAGTNVFVGDGGTGVNQRDPAIDVDPYGQPYLVWTDSRQATTEIYYAATTFMDPTPLDSKVVAASAAAVVGTDPAAIKTVQDVSLVVPAGAYPTDLGVTISRVLNPQVSPAAVLGSYDFGPSGTNFSQPVTVTIPYAVTPTTRRVLPYWYDSVTGALSQQGITDIRNLNISPKLSALQFRTAHFTPYYLVDVDVEDVGGGSGGGCAVSATGHGSPGQLLVPYGAIAAICLILRHRDRRNRMVRQ